MADNTKLDLETFVRADYDLRADSNYYQNVYDEFWGMFIRYYLDAKSGLFIDTYSVSRNPQYFDEFVANWQDRPGFNRESVKSVIKTIENAKDKPDDARNIIEIIKFARKPFNNRAAENVGKEHSLYVLKFIDMLGKFKDQDLVYEVARELRGIYSYTKDVNILKALSVMLANNKNATVEDVYEVFEMATTTTDAMVAINDVFGKTDEEITKILSKDVPDIAKLQRVVNYPKRVVGNAKIAKHNKYSDVPEYGDLPKEVQKFYNDLYQLGKQVEDKYDINKILEIGDNNYVAKYDESLMQKVSSLEKQVEVSKQDVKRAQSENQSLAHELEMRDEKIAELQKKLQDERSAKDDSENTRKMLAGQLKLLQELMNKVRGGLGSRGIDELRQAMEKANSMTM